MLLNNASGPNICFRAGFWPDCYRQSTEIGPPGRPEDRFLCFLGSSPVKIPARKHYLQTGAGPQAEPIPGFLVRKGANIEHVRSDPHPQNPPPPP